MRSEDEGLDGSRVPCGSDLTGLRRDATESIAVVLEESIELKPLNPKFFSSTTNEI